MALPIFSIGTFRFLALEGQPLPDLEEVDVVARPGVNGVGLWKLGKRGSPFTIVSKVDAITKIRARALYASYKQLIAADPVVLVWSSINLRVTEEFLVAVLDVIPTPGPSGGVRGLGSASGGLNPPSLGFIACQWTLIAIPE